MSRFWLLSLGLLAFALYPGAAPAAVQPSEVWILVNKNVADSRTIAEYYCRCRGVPLTNILNLDLPTGEDINRAAYEAKLAGPLRTLLNEKRSKVKVLLSTYGVPLRVGPDSPSAAELTAAAALQGQIDTLNKQRVALDQKIAMLLPLAQADPKGQAAADLAKARADRQAVGTQLDKLLVQYRWLTHKEAVAAVDSELAFLWFGTYELRLWRDNPLYFRAPDYIKRTANLMVMTARLDGPNVALVKGMIDRAIAAEKRGLQGKAYVDAQGRVYNPKYDPAGMGYEAYDESLREMAAMYGKGGVRTILDNKPSLFAVGACPDCALYCGWYSRGKYIDSFTFVPGAIGYHMASDEAGTLRNPTATNWCKRMIEKGITATLGPVAEPYTYGFPKPAEFFGCVGSKMTLVEAYWSSLRYGSWVMVLVGDPLYNPYGHVNLAPRIILQPSPAGSN